MRTRRVGVVVVAVLAVTACSGGRGRSAPSLSSATTIAIDTTTEPTRPPPDSVVVGLHEEPHSLNPHLRDGTSLAGSYVLSAVYPSMVTMRSDQSLTDSVEESEPRVEASQPFTVTWTIKR